MSHINEKRNELVQALQNLVNDFNTTQKQQEARRTKLAELQGALSVLNELEPPTDENTPAEGTNNP